MQIYPTNKWDITPKQAALLQKELSTRVTGGRLPETGKILGLDVSYRRGNKTLTASAVLLSFPAMEVLGTWRKDGLMEFPYIPGLLSFMEVPPLLPLLSEIPEPDIIMVDGAGIAHPRKFGLASHLGLITGKPSVGCAKSHLTGEYSEPGKNAFERMPLMIEGKIAGYVLRSKNRCRPLYISPGHLLDSAEALKCVLLCLRGYKLPEPTRLADLVSKGREIPGISVVTIK